MITSPQKNWLSKTWNKSWCKITVRDIWCHCWHKLQACISFLPAPMSLQMSSCFSVIVVRNFLLKVMFNQDYVQLNNQYHAYEIKKWTPFKAWSHILFFLLRHLTQNDNHLSTTQMSNYDVKKRTGKKGRPLEETARWLIVPFPSSLNSQSFSTDFDEIGCQRVNEISVRTLFRLTCKIIIAQKIATYSRESQTQFKIIGAIWWHLKQSKEMKLIKTTKTAVLFKQSALLSQHEDWKSTKLDSSAIFCKTISHCLCYEFKTYKYQRNTYNTICNLFKTMFHCIVRFPNHYFW